MPMLRARGNINNIMNERKISQFVKLVSEFLKCKIVCNLNFILPIYR